MSAWLTPGQPPRAARVQLLCLPHAGGSSAAYRTWQRHFPDEVWVRPVHLPGRGGRFGEPAVRRMGPLTSELASLIASEAATTALPVALFGHSMGALIAFETARALRRRALPAPVAMVLSATSAPRSGTSGTQLHRATDQELLESLRDFGGSPPEALADADLMGVLLPVFRADFEIMETYEYRDEPPLAVPARLLCGRDDAMVSPMAMLGWRTQFDPSPRLEVLPGGHFYLTSQLPEVARLVTDAVVANLGPGLGRAVG